MVVTIYSIILTYFLIGGVGFYFINMKRKPEDARHNRIKYISYFIIINVLFLSIVTYPLLFRVVTCIILLAGLTELIRLFYLSHFQARKTFIIAVTIYLVLAFLFFIFSGKTQALLLFTFLVISIFDSFSQISGQLWGRTKLVPRISPGKTIEGLAGGTLVAMVSALLLRKLVPLPYGTVLLISLVIVLFAFTGDLLASFYKRKFNVKDYSNLIPGHGGFLDRFDSLIAGGASVSLLWYLGILNNL